MGRVSKQDRWSNMTIITYKDGSVKKEIGCKRCEMKAVLAQLRGKGYKIIGISHID